MNCNFPPPLNTYNESVVDTSITGFITIASVVGVDQTLGPMTNLYRTSMNVFLLDVARDPCLRPMSSSSAHSLSPLVTSSSMPRWPVL